jgi:cytochrome b6-f complex iron-sulfur subunit
MDRKDFLNKLSGGLAITCVSCMMAACSKEEDNGGGGGNTPTLTIDLNAQLTNVGDFVAESGIIVLRLAAGNQVSSFRAFSNVCPHEAGVISYNKTTTIFTCARHGATFNQSGAVTNGPATSGMRLKVVTITGNTLTV